MHSEPLSHDEALAQVADYALTATHVADLLHGVSELVARALRADCVGVVELLSEGEMILSAGVGWDPGHVGAAVLDVGPTSSVGFALRQNPPVVSLNLSSEERFSPSPLLQAHALQSNVSSSIQCRKSAFGVLAAHSKSVNAFEPADAAFLRAAAGLLGVAIERIRSENALASSEARYGALLHAVPDILFRIARDGTYLDVWSQSEKELLVPQRELLGKKIQDFFTPEQSAEALAHLQRTLATHTMQFYEYELDIEGEPIYFEARLVPHGHEEVLAIVRNVTEKHRAEETLRLSEERFRSIFEVSLLGMAIIAADDRFLEVNQAFCELLGYRSGELLQMTWMDVTHPEDIEKTRVMGQRVENGDLTEVLIEKRYITKRSETIHARVFGSVVPDVSGQPLYLVATFEDITERKRTQEKLEEFEAERRQHELEMRLQVVQAQDRERASLSRELHDSLGQILYSLQLSLETKRRDRGDLAPEIGTLRMAISTVRQLSKMLHPPELELGDVGAVVEEYLCTKSERPEVTFEVVGKEPALDRLQKTHLYRIVQEAVASSIRDARPSRVHVSFMWDGGSLLLTVEDDGSTMAAGPDGGMGMRNLRDRATLLHGTTTWTHGRHGGSVFKLEIPDLV
jgi:PAS domain S-box-containing protein